MNKLKKSGVILLLAFITITCLYYLKNYFSKGSKKNVVVILVDTLRADHLGIYGYERDTSPNIDSFAKENLFYRNAITSAPWTPPAVASVMSGLYVGAHGLMPPNSRSAAKVQSTKLDPSIYTLQKFLTDNGYSTTGITPNPWITKEFGFDHGFENFISLPREAYADVVTDEGIKNVKEMSKKDKPFFLYLHYLDPHNPYKPKEDFGKIYNNYLKSRKYEKNVQRLINLYDSEIKFTDREIGRFLGTLKEEGLYDDTIIVFVADHGEQFKEHGKMGHGISLFEPEIHIPLIIKSGAKHKEVDTTVSLVDIYPTIVDLLGLIPPPHLQGVSLVDKDKLENRNGVISELTRKSDRRAFISFDGKKLILDFNFGKGEPTVVGLFDRLVDKVERVSLDDPELLQILKKEELTMYSKILESKINPEVVDVSDEKIQQLKSLGYLK